MEHLLSALVALTQANRMNDCVFSSVASSASSSGIGSYAQAARMGTGLMGASSSAMGGMVAWMNCNQCGDISEIVVTPDKSWVVPVAETTTTILDNIGSSLKNHGGNSTWGSNGHFYWHGSGKQGFYGNQYVTATKLSVIGVKIAKYTGPTGKTLDFIQLTNGIYSDYEAYGQYGYTNGYNSIMATASIVGGSGSFSWVYIWPSRYCNRRHSRWNNWCLGWKQIVRNRCKHAI